MLAEAVQRADVLRSALFAVKSADVAVPPTGGSAVPLAQAAFW
jgi:hypothetical protein